MSARDNRMQYTSKGVGIDLLEKGQVEADLHLLHIQCYFVIFFSW